MDDGKLMTRASFIVAAITLILSFSIFYYDTNQLMKSFGAALITAALVFATYMVLRWLVLAWK